MLNSEVFKESSKFMPGGVNSPVRAYKGLDIDPPIIKEGKGSYIYDVEGNKYLDFVCAWGPMILGHCNKETVEAIKNEAEKALAFGAPTYEELELAKYICETVNIDMIRMVNSGTEATMSAVRLARGYTGKDKIVKMIGCYHGHYDGFLVAAGSGVLTTGIPGSKGVPEDHIKNTLLAKYNDIENIRELFKAEGENIAAVILEPIAGNMGVIKANKEWLKEIRTLCDKYGAVLIFDEVMCGFRVSYKGARDLYDVEPDLVTYAKIIGGGLPCGAYGGKKQIMERLAPIGDVYQAGTMSGNPLVVAAGLATLTKLNNNRDIYEKLECLGKRLEDGVNKIKEKKNFPIVVNRCGSMITVFFTDKKEINTYEDVMSCSVDNFNKYFKHMLKKGIHLPPSQFETMFLSESHSEKDIDKYLEALKELQL